jgi:hypothetical protein
VKRISVHERRARLAVRHRLAPGHRARDVKDAAESVVCLHATDPATVYLSVWARMDDMTVADLDGALYDDRSIVKHLAMRRTLFAFPRELLPFAQAGASNRVADAQRRRLVKEVEAAGLHRDGDRWLSDACDEVLATLAGGREASSSELRKEIASLEGAMTYGEGRSWGGRVSVGPRVLTILSAEGRIVRATNAGGWYVSRPRWASMEAWLGAPIDVVSPEVGVAALVRSWLRAFGPGTVADLQWWLGSTLTAVRRALVDVEAIEVDVDAQPGFVLPDDLEPTEDVPPWAALLPPLDPTTMGWTEREWYLGPHKADLFDTAGNAGPTIWWDGRIVGGWRQRQGGEVELQLLEDVGSAGRRAIEDVADRLTSWFAGRRVLPRFPSPLSRAVAGEP